MKFASIGTRAALPSRLGDPAKNCAGFTLFEALVALALVLAFVEVLGPHLFHARVERAFVKQDLDDGAGIRLCRAPYHSARREPGQAIAPAEDGEGREVLEPPDRGLEAMTSRHPSRLSSRLRLSRHSSGQRYRGGAKNRHHPERRAPQPRIERA